MGYEYIDVGIQLRCQISLWAAKVDDVFCNAYIFEVAQHSNGKSELTDIQICQVLFPVSLPDEGTFDAAWAIEQDQDTTKHQIKMILIILSFTDFCNVIFGVIFMHTTKIGM